MSGPNFAGGGFVPEGSHSVTLGEGEHVFTPAAVERLLARVVVADPWWFRPLVVVLAVLPGRGRLSERLDRWNTARAVERYRARGAA